MTMKRLHSRRRRALILEEPRLGDTAPSRDLTGGTCLSLTLNVGETVSCQCAWSALGPEVLRLVPYALDSSMPWLTLHCPLCQRAVFQVTLVGLSVAWKAGGGNQS